jgi:cytochrome c-type biogenesis protein CcmF
MTFAVLLGTLFPLIVEAVSGQKVTVGAPFFNQLSFPLWMAIFALMGIGPLLPWRKAEHQSLLRNLAWLVGAAVVAGVVAYTLGVHKFYPLLTVALAAYNLASITLLLSGSLVPRMRLSGRGFFRVLGQYATESRRRVGSIIVHFAVIVIALGIAGSGGYRVDEQLRIDLGKSAEFQGFELRAVDRFMNQTPGRVQAGAVVEVWREGRQVTTLRPSVNVYSGSQTQPVPTPDVYYGLWSDVYLNIAGTVSPDQNFVVLRAVQSPLVAWIWAGALILVLGTVYSLLPPVRPSRVRESAKDVATV